MSSPTAWMLSLCTSISLLLGAAVLLTPDSRQKAKTAATAPAKAADGPVRASAQRIDLSKAMNVNLPATSRDFEAASFGGVPEKPGAWMMATAKR